MIRKMGKVLRNEWKKFWKFLQFLEESQEATYTLANKNPGIILGQPREITD